MAAFAKYLSRISGVDVDIIEVLEIIFMFCGVGLAVSLLAASFGADLW